MTKLPLLLGMLLIGLTGCTSHSWTKLTRQYAVTYNEVFEHVPVEAKRCEMSLKESKPESGLLVLNSHRAVDKVLTGSLVNMFASDEVIVKVTGVDPSTTELFIDSKARGQIGPDLGRTDRNVQALADVLDQVWPQIGTAREERGEKRPGKEGVSTQPAESASPQSDS
jgi:hypothetical protein